MKNNYLDDILEQDFKNLANEKLFDLEEKIKRTNNKHIVKKKNVYQRINDWFNYYKHEMVGYLISSTIFCSLNLISYTNLYATNLLREVSLKNFLVPSNPLFFLFYPSLLLIPSYLNFVKNSDYFLTYLKIKKTF